MGSRSHVYIRVSHVNGFVLFHPQFLQCNFHHVGSRFATYAGTLSYGHLYRILKIMTIEFIHPALQFIRHNGNLITGHFQFMQQIRNTRI